jgi:hypothetical protein
MAAQPATPVQLLFTPLESELLKEVQALRRDPPAYATLLEQVRHSPPLFLPQLVEFNKSIYLSIN